MAKFSADNIEDIKNKLSIVDVVQDYVHLNPRGANFWGLCPFHNEKTPSFTVSEEKKIFKCFGCQKGGGIFDFVMEMENITFPEAVEKLADRAGVKLKKSSFEDYKISERKILYEIYDRLAKSFNYVLNNNEKAKNAVSYLDSRNINQEMRDKYLLGYAPNSYDWLYNFLKKKGYSDDILEKSGLFSKKNKKISLFRNRIMFPVRDTQNRVVAFSGRALSPNDKAKYINSSDSLIYSKRNTLYGLYESKEELRKNKEKNIIICEGNFDVITLKQIGCDIVVAPLGTAFTQEQVQLLKKYNPSKVILFFDNDNAGINATNKALTLLLENNIDGYVINLSGAKDPNEFISKFGSKKLNNIISKPIKGLNYLVNISNKLYDIKGIYGKKKIVEYLLPYLIVAEDDLNGNEIYKFIAESLNFDENTLRREVSKRKGRNYTNNDVDVVDKKITFQITAISSFLLAIITHREYCYLIDGELENKDLETETEIELFNVITEARQRAILDSNELILELFHDKEIKDYVRRAFVFFEDNNDDIKEGLEKQLAIIKKNKLKKRRNKLKKILKNSSITSIDRDEIYMQLLEIDQKIKE